MYEIVHLIVRDDDYLVPDAVIGSQMTCHISEGLRLGTRVLKSVDGLLVAVDEYQVAYRRDLLVDDLVASVAIIESDVAVMDKIVGKPFLYIFLFVPGTNDEIIMSVVGILFHDMPKYRHTANLYHRLRLILRFLADTRAKASG